MNRTMQFINGSTQILSWSANAIAPLQ